MYDDVFNEDEEEFLVDDDVEDAIGVDGEDINSLSSAGGGRFSRENSSITTDRVSKKKTFGNEKNSLHNADPTGHADSIGDSSCLKNVEGGRASFRGDDLYHEDMVTNRDHHYYLYNSLLKYTSDVAIPLLDRCSFQRFERMISRYT